MSHTRKPWSVGDTVWFEVPNYHPAGGQRYRHIQFDGGTLALVIDDEGDPECEANIRLIPASPDLLDLLKEALESVDADESDRRESWPGEIKDGSLKLDLGDRIRDKITEIEGEERK